MKIQDIDHFFKLLNSQLDRKAEIILIGGAAALLFGGNRPTKDVDFEISTVIEHEKLQQAIEEAQKGSEIQAEYSENIDRWSQISLHDYRKHTQFYKSFGKIKVHILKPEFWSIGKMGRYYDSDVEDMEVVFKKQETDPDILFAVWVRALQKSEKSLELFHLRKHMVHFLKTYGPKIWGKKFDADTFLQKASLKYKIKFEGY